MRRRDDGPEQERAADGRTDRHLHEGRHAWIVAFPGSIGQPMAIERDLYLDTFFNVAKFPKAHFVWLMGGDNLADFHRWRRWKEIATRIPIAIVARPGFTTRALASLAAQHLRAWRIHDAAQIPEAKPPAWAFIQERLDPASATALRAKGVWR